MTGKPDLTQREEPRDLLDSRAAGGKAIRGGAVRVAGYVVGVLVSVVAAALLFRHLGVVGAGEYTTVLAIVAVAQSVSDAGLTTIGLREASVRRGDERARLLQDLLGLRLALTLAGVAGATAFAALAGYDRALVAGTAVAGFGLLVTNVQATYAVSLTAELRLVGVAAAELLRNVLLAACVIAFVVLGAGLLPILAIPIPVGLVVLGFTIALLRNGTGLAPRFNRSRWWALLRETLPFAAAAIAYALYFRIAIILLSLLGTKTEVGYFGASFRVIEVLIVVPNLMIGSVFPIFSRAASEDPERLAYAVRRTFQAATLVGTLLSLGVIIGAPLVIDIVAGPAFTPAAGVLRLHAVAFLILFAVATGGYALLTVRLYSQLLLLSLVALVGTAVTTALTARSLGAEGAALATVVGELLTGAGVVISLARYRPDLRVPLLDLSRVVLAGALGSTVLLIAVPVTVRLILGLAIYLGAAVALRAVPPELTMELRALAHRLKAQLRGV